MDGDKRVTRSQVADKSPEEPAPASLHHISEMIQKQLGEHHSQMQETYGKRLDGVESVLRDLGELVVASRREGVNRATPQESRVSDGTESTSIAADAAGHDAAAPALPAQREWGATAAGETGGRKPQDFDGSASLAAYRAQFELIAKSSKWSERRKAVELAASLKGPAMEVLACVPPQHLESYEALTEVLEQRFGAGHQEQLHRTRLRNRVRGNNEGLQELALDVEHLAYLAYPGAPTEFRATIACDQFIDALEDTDMQMAVRQAKPSRLRDALGNALEYESLRRSLKTQWRQGQNSGFSNRQASVETPVAQQSMNDKLDAILTRIQQLESSRPRQTANRPDDRRQTGLGPCWNCNRMGHIRRHCREPSRMSTSGASSRQGNE